MGAAVVSASARDDRAWSVKEAKEFRVTIFHAKWPVWSVGIAADQAPTRESNYFGRRIGDKGIAHKRRRRRQRLMFAVMDGRMDDLID